MRHTRSLRSFVLLALVPCVLFAQRRPRPLTIAYQIAMPEPASHLYEIAIDVDGVTSPTLPLQLPVWSPGRYAKMDFAKNVQDFQATDADGHVLAWDKTSGSRWVVATRGVRAVRVRYRSFDDVFNALKRRSWNAPNASYYLQGRGYTERDVERAASEVAGEDLHDWFARHVGGTEDVEYDAVLAPAGLRLVRETPWRIEELPGATPAQRAVRDGWTSGRMSARREVRRRLPPTVTLPRASPRSAAQVRRRASR